MSRQVEICSAGMVRLLPSWKTALLRTKAGGLGTQSSWFISSYYKSHGKWRQGQVDVLVLPVWGPVLSLLDALKPKCLQLNFRPAVAAVCCLYLSVLLQIFCKVGYFVVEFVLFNVMLFFPSSMCFWKIDCNPPAWCLYSMKHKFDPEETDSIIGELGDGFWRQEIKYCQEVRGK